jgi:hypothetical protein
LPSLPDSIQREFEVTPDRRMISIYVIRRSLLQDMSPHQDRIVDRIVTAIVKWLRVFDTRPGEAKCLGCGCTLADPGTQSEAYAVGLPTAKMHKRGRMAGLVGGICATCCRDRSDDDLNEIARKQWAPHAVPTQGGTA